MKLLTMACPRNLDGEFVSEELAEDQSLETLYSFGDRLASLYEKHFCSESTSEDGK